MSIHQQVKCLLDNCTLLKTSHGVRWCINHGTIDPNGISYSSPSLDVLGDGCKQIPKRLVDQNTYEWSSFYDYFVRQA